MRPLTDTGNAEGSRMNEALKAAGRVLTLVEVVGTDSPPEDVAAAVVRAYLDALDPEAVQDSAGWTHADFLITDIMAVRP